MNGLDKCRVFSIFEFEKQNMNGLREGPWRKAFAVSEKRVPAFEVPCTANLAAKGPTRERTAV